MQKVLDFLKENYGQSFDVKSIAIGRDKEVYLASSLEGKFVVSIDKKKSISRRHRTIEAAEFQQGLFSRGFSTSQIIKVFQLKDSRIAVLSTFIEGSHIDNLTPGNAYKVGEALGHMHAITQKGEIYQEVFYKRYWICGIIKAFPKMFRIFRCFCLNRFFRRLPVGICHRDLHLKNILFGNDKAYLIDFDRHRVMPYVEEVCKFIDLNLDEMCRSSFVAGYVSRRQFTEAEKKFMVKDISC